MKLKLPVWTELGKKKVEDPDEFRANQNDRKKKSDQNKKAENTDIFRENQNDRIKKSEQNKKDLAPDNFKENLNNRGKTKQKKRATDLKISEREKENPETWLMLKIGY